MKKYLLLFLLLFALSGFAQENVIKMGVAGIGYGDFSLGYERKITPKSSLNVNFGWVLPKVSFVEDRFMTDMSSVDALPTGLLDVTRLFHASADYRFYLGNKEAPRGFYLAPYFRYWNFWLVMTDLIDNENQGEDYYLVSARISSAGIGIQMGYQWIISDVITVDWYFMGFGAEYVMPKLTYQNVAYAIKGGFDYNTITDDIEGSLDGLGYFQNKLKMKANSDNLTVRCPVFLPGIKTGLSIGFAF